MGKIEVKPAPHVVGKAVIVTGSAKATVYSLKAVLTHGGGTVDSVFTSTSRVKRKRNRYQYVILIPFDFAAGPPGPYTVTVKGTEGAGTAVSSPAVPVLPGPAVAAPAAAAAGLPTITIDSHADGDDISAESETFVAWGTIGNGFLYAVTMNGIPADFVFEDGSYWVAQLPPLDPGVYTLLAVAENATPAYANACKVGLTVS